MTRGPDALSHVGVMMYTHMTRGPDALSHVGLMMYTHMTRRPQMHMGNGPCLCQ